MCLDVALHKKAALSGGRSVFAAEDAPASEGRIDSGYLGGRHLFISSILPA
jgi:hypothetical protein